MEMKTWPPSGTRSGLIADLRAFARGYGESAPLPRRFAKITRRWLPADLGGGARVDADDAGEVAEWDGDVLDEVAGVRCDEHHAVACVDGDMVNVVGVGRVVVPEEQVAGPGSAVGDVRAGEELLL